MPDYPETEDVYVEDDAGECLLYIQWQRGPVREHGTNGVQAPEVLQGVLDYLRVVNVPPYDTDETDQAIGSVKEAIAALNRRTEARERRGVEGTSAV